MKIPCDKHVACPCEGLLTNYSSEDPDRLMFLARRYGPMNPPGMNRPDNNLDCTTFASSPISEEDADFCAVRHQTMCEQTGSTIVVTSGIAPDPCVFCRPSPPGSTPVGLPVGGSGNDASFGTLTSHCTDDDGNIIPCPDPCCDPSTLPENAADIGVTTTDEDGNVILKCCCNPVPGDPDVPDEPPDTPDDPDEPPQPQLFGNSPQTCEATCANGGKLSATVGANYFIAASASLANSMAHSYACRLANERKARLCIGNLGDATVCQQYSQQLTTETPDSRIRFFKVLGPGWVSISSSGLVTGRPTGADANTSELLSVGVTDFDGFTVVQDVFITVNPSNDPCFDNTTNLGTADSNPQGPSFSAQLVPHQPAEPSYIYTLVSGALPPGLNLNSTTGLISGHASQPDQDYNFTIGLGGVCEPCQKAFVITVLCNPIDPDVPPSPQHLQRSAKGSDALSFRFCQRSGVVKNLRITAQLDYSPTTNVSVDYSVAVYLTYAPFTQIFAINNNLSGGPGGCLNPHQNDSIGPSVFGLASCVSYTVVYTLTVGDTGLPAASCLQAANYQAVWL